MVIQIYFISIYFFSKYNAGFLYGPTFKSNQSIFLYSRFCYHLLKFFLLPSCPCSSSNIKDSAGEEEEDAVKKEQVMS